MIIILWPCNIFVCIHSFWFPFSIYTLMTVYFVQCVGFFLLKCFTSVCVIWHYQIFIFTWTIVDRKKFLYIQFHLWWSLVFENVTNVYTNWFYIYGGHEFLNDDHTHTLAHTHNVNVGFCLCQKEKNWHSKKLLVDQSKKKRNENVWHIEL